MAFEYCPGGMSLDLIDLEVHFHVLLTKVARNCCESGLKDPAIDLFWVVTGGLSYLGLAEIAWKNDVVPFFSTPFVPCCPGQCVINLLFQ